MWQEVRARGRAGAASPERSGPDWDCLQPILDEEATEKPGVSPAEPSMSVSQPRPAAGERHGRLPAALLQQYPGLVGLGWTAVPSVSSTGGEAESGVKTAEAGSGGWDGGGGTSENERYAAESADRRTVDELLRRWTTVEGDYWV